MTASDLTAQQPGASDDARRSAYMAYMAATIAKISGLPESAVVPEADLVEDLCVDSVAKIELMVACEARFGIQVPDEVISRFHTVGSVLDYLVAVGDRSGTGS